MRVVKSFLFSHPVVTLVYALYLFLWYGFVKISLNINAAVADRQAGEVICGQSAVFGFFLMIGITFLYLSVTFGQIIFSMQKRFYAAVALFILVPALAVALWGFM